MSLATCIMLQKGMLVEASVGFDLDCACIHFYPAYQVNDSVQEREHSFPFLLKAVPELDLFLRLAPILHSKLSS